MVHVDIVETQGDLNRIKNGYFTHYVSKDGPALVARAPTW